MPDPTADPIGRSASSQGSASSAFECYRKICDPALEGKPWLVVSRRTITFGQLRRRIELTASMLASMGIAIGERVVVATLDDCEAALSFVSLICSGVVAVNLDPQTGPERARALVAKASPRLIVMDSELVNKWQLPASGAKIIEIGTAPVESPLFGRVFGRQASRPGLHALLDAHDPVSPSPIPSERLAYVMFTSGTTAKPKGVSISHRALFAHLQTLSRYFKYDPSSRIMNTLMLAHADGMIQGPVIAFHDAIPVFRPVTFDISTIERFLDATFQLRITHLVAVPTMLSLIHRLGTDQRDAFQGGDFRLLISCGATLEAALCENFETAFRVPIVNVYGLTETVSGGVFSGPDGPSRLPGGIGLPVDCELRIVDQRGMEAAVGQSGELWMRGELLMSGYFDAPDLTAEVMANNWFRTGDAATRDAAGRYRICGRYKSLIIRGGYNIHPEEVSEVLERYPGVREAATVGLADAVWGEIVVSVVSADAAVSNEELLAHCARQLEPRKVPTRIERVESLPRGLSGKVQSESLRELLRNDPIQDTGRHAVNGDRAQRLLAVAALCFKAPARSLTLASTPRDVPGWDSLAHLEFVCALEQAFDVQLTPRDIMGLNRLSKALDLIDRS